MSSRDGRTPRRSGGNCGFHLSREECESSILLVSGNISSHQIIVGCAFVSDSWWLQIMDESRKNRLSDLRTLERWHQRDTPPVGMGRRTVVPRG